MDLRFGMRQRQRQLTCIDYGVCHVGTNILARHKQYAEWYNKVTASNKPITPTLQIGVVYWGDTGNGNMICGMLVRYEAKDAILVDARGKEHIAISSTLRPAYN